MASLAVSRSYHQHNITNTVTLTYTPDDRNVIVCPTNPMPRGSLDVGSLHEQTSPNVSENVYKNIVIYD